MDKCNHDITDKSTAAKVDRLCLLCLQAENKRLKHSGTYWKAKSCPACQEPPESEIEAVMKMLEIYGETDKPVSQGFYQSLCLRAREYLTAQQQRIEELGLQIDVEKRINNELVKADEDHLSAKRGLEKRLKSQLAKCDKAIKFLWEKLKKEIPYE